MANDTYLVEDRVGPGTPSTVVVNDDGSGTDWLVMGSAHTESDIRLTYSTIGGGQAAGYYRDPLSGNTSRFTLLVNGVIENARGSTGSDTIYGSIGNNILFGDSTATGPGGSDTLRGDAGNDLIYGGAGADNVIGGNDRDTIFGGSGNDSLGGGLGNDTVEGGAGADILSGGQDGRDLLSYVGSGAGVRISLTYGIATLGQGGDAAGDSITGFNSIRGSDFNDRFTDTVADEIAFSYNANTFEGRGGDDFLQLGGGRDKGYGGAGNDEIHGGGQRDDLFGGDSSDRLYGEGGLDELFGGTGSDSLYSGGGDDTLVGGEGVDTLAGATGLDRLEGGRGADVLQGGADADNFIYRSLQDGGDRILGLGNADRVRLNFTDLPGIDLYWDASGPFGGTRGAVRLADTGADLQLWVDTDGDSGVEFRLTLVGISDLGGIERSVFVF